MFHSRSNPDEYQHNINTISTITFQEADDTKFLVCISPCVVFGLADVLRVSGQV